jgi:hypothetical protein
VNRLLNIEESWFTSKFVRGAFCELISHRFRESDEQIPNLISLLDTIRDTVVESENFDEAMWSIWIESIYTQRQIIAPQFGLGYLIRNEPQSRMDCLIELACGSLEIGTLLKSELTRLLCKNAVNLSEDNAVRRWSFRACLRISGVNIIDGNCPTVSLGPEEIELLTSAT